LSYSENFIGVSAKWKALAKRKYSFYCEYTHRGRWLPGKHHEYIANCLDKNEQGDPDYQYIILTLPPRSGKSMEVTETYPSYFIGKGPNRRVIEVSYSDGLARKFGRKNRYKIQRYGQELFGISISSTNAAANNWGIEGYDGGMISSGLQGQVTGEGADLMLIDDPIKNRAEANSETYRNSVWDEFRDTLWTRLHAGGRLIIILTRWHEDDLVGRLTNPKNQHYEQELASKFKVINFPAEAEEDDILGRQPGDPLWPEHGYDKSWIALTKIAVGSRGWASLYQQRPAPAEGNIIKRIWIQFYTELPHNLDNDIQSWDMAFTDKESSSYVVGQRWITSGSAFYLVDQVRAHMDFPASCRAVETFTAKHPTARGKLVEAKANGEAVMSTLRGKLAGIIPIQPEGGKVVRAQAMSPFWEAGNVFLPHPSIAPWVHDYIEEIVAFPNATDNDQMDSTSQAINWLANKPKPTVGTVKAGRR
jgi:predicted phage terminase large subunit-like protein